MFEDGLITPQPASAAEYDLASAESGPGGDWPREALDQPRILAAKLLRQQSDYVAAIGTLFLADEVLDPVMTLLRGAFEYGARAAWLMDPTVGHRVRCARAVLTEVVSLEMSRRSASRMPATPARTAARTEGKARWKQLARAIDDCLSRSIEPTLASSGSSKAWRTHPGPNSGAPGLRWRARQSTGAVYTTCCRSARTHRASWPRQASTAPTTEGSLWRRH